ncbi:MAG: hypothetical protein OEZ38_10500 [Gammaproteobacteria bacterium]|nr:hypothetical protein [Gammaproteobacteria bacterium]
MKFFTSISALTILLFSASVNTTPTENKAGIQSKTATSKTARPSYSMTLFMPSGSLSIIDVVEVYEEGC